MKKITDEEIREAIDEALGKKKEPSGCLPVTLAVLITLPLSYLLRGIVLLKYWEWFVMPFGVQAIAFWHAIGLAALVSYITMKSPDWLKKKSANFDNSDDQYSWTLFWRGLAFAVLANSFALLFGWIYASLM